MFAFIQVLGLDLDKIWIRDLSLYLLTSSFRQCWDYGTTLCCCNELNEVLNCIMPRTRKILRGFPFVERILHVSYWHIYHFHEILLNEVFVYLE